MENNELNIKITSTMNKALESIDRLISKTKNADSVVTKMFAHIDKEGQLTGFTTEFKNLNSTMNETTNVAKKLKSALDLTTIYTSIKAISRKFYGLVEQTIDYSEALNLFNVVLDESQTKALKFQNTMNEAFGTNQTETLTRQGLYQSMAENMGIASDYAYIMSENTTKLVNDISSLYNKNENTVAEALRAGIYAGQTKPLRSFGMDVTEKTLQPELDRLGIDRTVRELSQAEKQLLRYISVLRQSTEAQGDWANTIESPANQLKIFKNQIEETKKSIGNLFVGAFAKILPYANAIVMVVEEVANAIASLLGIDVSDYNTSIADIGDAFVDLEEDIDGATGSAKELKRQLLKFDQVNNINEDKSSNGSSSVSSGIDQRLLDAINGYDNGMNSVKMKAIEIRDRIMEWLGFTKEVDSVTGDVSFSLNSGHTKLKSIAKIIGILVGYKIFKGLKNICTILGKVKTFFGGTTILTKLNKLKKLIEKNGLTKGVSKFATGLSKFNKIAMGLPIAIVSIVGASNSLKDLADGSGKTSDALIDLVGSLTGAIAGGATFGSAFGPLGAIIGGVAGGVIALTGALVGYSSTKNEIKKMNDLFDGQGISIEVLSDHITALCGESIPNYITSVEELAIQYQNEKSDVDEAQRSLKVFLDTLELQDEQISKSQLSELSAKYDGLITATDNAWDASIKYFDNLIKKYKEASDASSESTASQIADTIALMNKGKDYELEYLEQEKNLTIAKYTGKITADEYNKAIENLKIEYGYLADKTVDAEGVVKDFSSSLKDIDYSNVDTANSSIQTTIEKYEGTIDKLDEYKKLLGETTEEQTEWARTTISNYDKTIENGNKLSDTQQAIYDTAKGILDGTSEITTESVEEVNETISKLQGEYKGYLSSIYLDLANQGLLTSSGFKETVDSIETELGKLKNVEMTGVGKTLFDSMFEDIQNEYPYYDKKIYSVFKKIGVGSLDAIQQGWIEEWKTKEKTYNNFGSDIAYKITDGYKKGLEENSCSVNDTTEKVVAENGYKKVKDYLDINSPSKLYEKLGKFTAKGYIDGITNEKSEILQTITNLLDEITKEFKKVSFSINISDNVEKSFNSILTKLQKFTDKFRSGINTMLSNMTTSMNNIKVGKDEKIYYTSMPKITVPKFENGGFPEDGLFYANHNEFVGKFSNGKTAVANNEMIVEGIKVGVYEAVSMAMANMGSSNVNVSVKADKGFIVETAVNGIQQHVNATGELPFTAPI